MLMEKSSGTSCVLAMCIGIVLALFLSGCDQASEQQNVTGQPGVMTLQAWAHAGQAAEREVLQSQVRQFNQQHTAIDIELTFIPERDYNAQVQAAALAGDLPDLLEFDGPYLYNYIWQGHLRPLDQLLAVSVLDDLLPSIVDQGTYGDHLYSVGVFDSGLGLYARRSQLESVGARLPANAAEAWSIEEFNTILSKLSQQDDDHAVLDLKLNYRGEWFSYGFSPVLQSAGADLVDRSDYQHSTGVLNSVESVSAMQQLQRWIVDGRVDPDLDDAAFVSGRVALSWTGHWDYARYHARWKQDLLLLPLPDFGSGSRTGQGSWSWAITRYSKHPGAAAAFIEFLLQTEQVLAMSNANGAVPATRSAVSQSTLYGPTGALRLFADQLIQGVSVPRPRTPAYPVITTSFQEAFQAIRNGGDVKQALDEAAQTIDRDIRDNQGYPFNAR